MRFNTVEVERAYMDYLDSLDDWPPPQSMPAEAAATMTQMSDYEERSAPTISASKFLQS